LRRPAPPTRLNARIPRDIETNLSEMSAKGSTRRYRQRGRRLRTTWAVSWRAPGGPAVGRLERTVKAVRRNPVVDALLAAVLLS